MSRETGCSPLWTKLFNFRGLVLPSVKWDSSALLLPLTDQAKAVLVAELEYIIKRGIRGSQRNNSSVP